MKPLLKLIHSVWLVALVLAFSLLLPIVASAFSPGPISFACDVQNQARIAYDEGSPSAFNYDCAAVPNVDGKESRAVRTADDLSNFAEFLAAEGGTQRLLTQGSTITDSSRLIPGVSGTANDVVVIGRQVDTAVAQNWPGYKTLNIQNWSIQANDSFIQAAINQRQTFYLGSPVNYQTLWNPARNSMTVLGRELGQIYQAGYQKVELNLVPPPLP